MCPQECMCMQLRQQCLSLAAIHCTSDDTASAGAVFGSLNPLRAFLRGMGRTDAYFHAAFGAILVAGFVFVAPAVDSLWEHLNRGVSSLTYITCTSSMSWQNMNECLSKMMSRHIKSSPYMLLCIFAAVSLSNECTSKGTLSVLEQRQSARALTDIGMVMQKLFKHIGPEGASSAPKVCRQPHHQAFLLMLPGDSTHRFAEELIL